MKTAFMVNPRAGCGVRHNMIGSDTLDVSLCRDSEATVIAEKFIRLLNSDAGEFLTASGYMGEEFFKRSSRDGYRVIYDAPEVTDSSDTESFLDSAKEENPDLLVFVGGDGTASVISKYGWDGLVLGIPAGTKMFSSVYPLNLQRALEIFQNIKRHGYTGYRWGEVVDIDNDTDKNRPFHMALNGYLKIPDSENILPFSKAETVDSGIEDLAGCFSSSMDSGIYIFGPGNTCKAIMSHIGLSGTIHGFDIVEGKSLKTPDASREEILEVSDRSRIVLSPLGGQGFLLGRGNRQIDRNVLENVRFDRVIVVASQRKALNLDTLYLDIPDYHGNIPPFIKVYTGCGKFKLMKTKT